MDAYLLSIDEELAQFEKNELITKDYRDKITSWAARAVDKTSSSFNGPTLEMDRTVSINGKSKSTTNSDADNIDSGATPCPENGEMRVRIAHESVIDLPIPGVTVTLYEDSDYEKVAGSKETDENGEAVFSGLTPGKLYWTAVTDKHLDQNVSTMLSAYDGLSQSLHGFLSGQWATWKPEWKLNPIAASLLDEFSDGLVKGLFSIWDDVKTAYNVIKDADTYAKEIYDGARALQEQVGQLDEEDVVSLLTSSKQMARELLALFNDEAALYLIARAIMLELRMYPWGKLLSPLVKQGGEIIGGMLSGVVFGALLSLITGPLGIAFLAYRLGQAFKGAMHLVKGVWTALKSIMESVIKLIQGYFDKIRNSNWVRQINARLKKNRRTEVDSSRTTETVLEQKTVDKASITEDGNGSRSADDTCTNGCPVSMVTGEELLALNDTHLPGVFPFTFTRLYRTSAVGSVSLLGHGWSHSLQHRIRFTEQGIVWTDHESLTTELPLPDRAIPAARNTMAEAAAWLSKIPGEYLLTSASLDGWVLHVQRTPEDTGVITGFSKGKQHLTLHCDDSGLPVRLENPAGAALFLHYQQTEAGPRLNELRLGYDPDAPCCPPELAPWETLSLMRYAYDEQGRLVTATSAAGESEHYAYREDNVITLRHLAGGAEFYWEWDGEGKSVRAIRHWSSLPNLGRRYQWRLTEDKTEVTVIYEDGSQEVWEHDSKTARLIKAITPAGAQTHRRYGEQGELLEETGPEGGVTRYSYNHDLLVTRITAPDGQVTRQFWNQGRLLERIRQNQDGMARQKESWKYDYDGNVILHTDPAGSQWRYEWDDAGNLIAVIHPDDSRETWQVNALGQVTEYCNRAGEWTYYCYNARGWLTEERRSQAANATAEAVMVWDNVGRLTAVTWADGRSRSWQFNPYHQVTEETDENGLTTRYHYQENSALVQKIELPDGSSQQFLYNNIHGQVSDIINGRGERYRIDYTPSGKLSEEHTFDGRRLCYRYDGADRLVSRTEYGESGSEATALTTIYAWDESNRLAARVRPDGRRIAYHYDGFGRLREVDDGEWPLGWGYDSCNRVTEEHQGFGSQYYGYDAEGHLHKMRLVDGNLVGMHWRQGQLFQIVHNGKILTEHTWSRGQEMTRRIGDSGDLQLRNLYDSRQRLVSQRLTDRQQEGDILRRDWQYDPAGRLEKIIDQRKGVHAFVHDLKGRLAEARKEAHPWHNASLPEELRRPGIYEQFTHDDADNLLGMDLPQEGQPHRATVKGDRLLMQGDHHYEYDEFGNLIADRSGKKQCREHLYQWDCEHRLVRFTEIRHYDYGDERHTERHSWNYSYDAFGRRVRKQDEETGKTTLFFWQDERMVTECDEKDALFDPRKVSNEYVKATDFDCTSYLYEPGSFRPLAQFKGRGRGGPVYWYINDHLGTPQEMVDGKGNIVWSGLYRSYGHLAIQGGAVRQPLRFQGQYADEESGLHYNRYRYYNPLSGRYISQDPVSVRGGINTYAYVPDPLAWIDPLGLTCGNATRVRHYTNRKGSNAISESGQIKAHDNGRVYLELANKKPLSQVDAEAKYQIGRGKGRDYVETDVPNEQLEWIANPRYHTDELTVKGNVILSYNAKITRRK